VAALLIDEAGQEVWVHPVARRFPLEEGTLREGIQGAPHRYRQPLVAADQRLAILAAEPDEGQVVTPEIAEEKEIGQACLARNPVGIHRVSDLTLGEIPQTEAGE
jgi:hypothetical protein